MQTFPAYRPRGLIDIVQGRFEALIVVNSMTINGNFFIDLLRRMERGSEKTFLECSDSIRVSYADANHRSAQIANKLSSLGIGKGCRLTAQVGKSKEAVLLYLACLRSGIIYHPLNIAYPLAELRHFLDDAQPAALVCGPEQLQELRPLASDCGVEHLLTLDQHGNGSLMDSIDNFSAECPVAKQRDDATAVLIYTSGTTGKPKGAMITHENIRSNAHGLCEIWNFQSSDVLMHVLPLFHVHGLFVALHCAMLNNSRILFHQKFSAKKTVEQLPKASVLMGVPTIYSRILQQDALDRNQCKNFRLFISGSAPLRPETFHAFEKRTGHRILERYGMTEAGMIASNPLSGERIAGTVGRALPDVQLRIRKSGGEIADSSLTGILEISGPNVFAGYWQNEQATRGAFCDDGFFITGDLATISDDGVLSIVGRQTDLIISAGFNIYPREVEVQLNQIKGVEDSAVFGVPHPDLGEAAVAAIIAQNRDALDIEMVRESLAGSLASFKVPRRFVIVRDFPRNAMGKIEKKQLRATYQNTFNAKK